MSQKEFAGAPPPGPRDYAEIFGHLLNGIAHCRMEFDEEGRPVDFVYLLVNPAFERLTGLREARGRRVSELIPGILETDRRLLELYARVALGGPPLRFEYRLEALDSWFLVSAFSPRRGEFVAVFEVVTERKAAELERERLLADLQRRNAELDAIFELAPVLLSIHQADGTWLRANESARRLFGLDPARFDRSSVAARLRARFADGRPLTPENMPSTRVLAGEYVRGAEYLIEGSDGETHTLLFNGFPLRIEGRPEGAVFAQVDVSSYKRIEAELAALLKEKDLILREAHHRIKNILASLESLIRLQAAANPSIEAAAALGEAADRVRGAQTLYRHLFEAGRYESLGLRELLPELVEEVIASYPSRSRPRLELACEELELASDKLQPFGLILDELVANAMKHAFAGREGGLLRVGLRREGDRLVLEVEDDGPGPEGGPRHEGFGLRLIQGLAAQLGGSFGVEGPGFRARLEFPV